MKKIVLLLFLPLVHLSASAMGLANTATSLITANSASRCLSTGHSSEEKANSLCTPQSLPIEETVLGKAIAKGKSYEVKKHFESYLSFFDYIHRRRRIAQALSYAAQFPVKQSGELISYLLGEVKSEYIEKPEKLIGNALHNNNQAILNYCAEHFPKIMQITLERVAIFDDNIEKTKMLLKAGLDPTQPATSHRQTLKKTIDGKLVLNNPTSMFNDIIIILSPNRVKILELFLKYSKEKSSGLSRINLLKSALKMALWKYEQLCQKAIIQIGSPCAQWKKAAVQKIIQGLAEELALYAKEKIHIDYQCSSFDCLPKEAIDILQEAQVPGQICKKRTIADPLFDAKECYSTEIVTSRAIIKSVLVLLGFGLTFAGLWGYLSA